MDCALARLVWKEEKSEAGGRDAEGESGALERVGCSSGSFTGGGGEVTVMGVLLEAGGWEKRGLHKGCARPLCARATYPNKSGKVFGGGGYERKKFLGESKNERTLCARTVSVVLPSDGMTGWEIAGDAAEGEDCGKIEKRRGR